jgi:CheY-like chemotaxis protein
MNIYVVNEMLKTKNFKSVSATGGAEALDILEERIENFLLGQDEMFKLILLDYSMPEMDGPAVARKIVKMFSNEALSM